MGQSSRATGTPQPMPYGQPPKYVYQTYRPISPNDSASAMPIHSSRHATERDSRRIASTLERLTIVLPEHDCHPG